MSEGYKPGAGHPKAPYYQPTTPEGRIARSVEMQAAKEFGPEGLSKSEVARALNLDESAISDEEWRDISEFAVNAGAELWRTAIEKDLPDDITQKEEKKLHKRIEKNKDKLDPDHDLFHAAETYRQTEGQEAGAPFAEVTDRERYTDPSIINSELWPLLFFTVPGVRAPLPVLLRSLIGRNAVEQFFTREDVSTEATGEEIKSMLSSVAPEDPLIQKKEYEHLIELVVIGNAQKNVEDITPEELQHLIEGLEKALTNPPEHYVQFAHRVFDEEWRENPRLFLDELMACIRTKPDAGQHV